jgi:phage terminase large subunit-like protein
MSDQSQVPSTIERSRIKALKPRKRGVKRAYRPDDPEIAPPRKNKGKPTGDAIVKWIETFLRVPEGRLIGKRFVLDDFQQQEIRKIYDNPHGPTRRAILSFGRKNGKTGLAAALLLVHLVGPCAIPNSNLYSAAQSRDQAALIFHMAAKMVRLSPELRLAVDIKDSTKELVCPALGTRYRALSADASTSFGLSPVFIIHDELGQVRGPRSALYEALETATGAQEAPLSVIISTQAPTDNDLLSVLIDDALADNDPRVVCRLYTAPMTLDPFDIETIRLANPALGFFLNETEVLAMAADAKRMSSREAEYRNLILNQRVEACQQFIQPGQWQACAAPVGDITQCDEVYGGLDLSEANDLTALVLIGKRENIWHVKPWFWLPSEGVYERSRTDHVPYDKWAEQGFLETVPGAAITYDVIATRICEILATHKGLQKIAFDRWNFAQFKPWLTHHKWTEDMIATKWVEFGQGTQSMSPALRELESRILRKEIRHGDHPILNMCCANAVIEGSKKTGGLKKDSSARKLSKKRSTGRIDGLVALAMAIGIAPMGAPIDVASLIG